MKLSIIIPLYNQEVKIKALLDVLVPQLNANTELIIVDDGSTDSSLSVCKEFENHDSLILIDKPNGGVSSARNEGLKVARGEFITFIDSDDMISNDYVKTVLELCAQNADLVQMNYYYKSKNRYFKTNFIHYTGKAKFDEFFYLIIKNIVNSPVNKIYKHSIIFDNNICFPEDISFGEDELFNIDYSMYSHDIYFCDKAIYYYWMIDGGLTMSFDAYKLLDTEKIAEQKLKKLSKTNHINFSEEIYNVRRLSLAISIINNMILQKKQKEAIDRILQIDNFYDSLFNVKVKSFNYKIKQFFIKYKFYWLIGIIIKIKK